jgi:uncharacterized repeat protein (TIGR01451 family)
LCNKAVATADGGLRDEVESCVNVVDAKLSLKKTGPRQHFISVPVPYQLTVTNEGTSPLTNVVVTDRLPAQTTFVSASNGGRAVGSQVQWSLGTLAPGASKTLDLKLRARTTGELVNQAEARAERGVLATAEARTIIRGGAGLLLEVIDVNDPIEVGEETQYQIIIRNQGSAPATKVRITANVPPELEITRVQGPVDHKKEQQKVSFDPLDVPPGADTVYRIHLRATKPGDVRFKVEMTGDQLPAGPVLEEESTTIIKGNGTSVR